MRACAAHRRASAACAPGRTGPVRMGSVSPEKAHLPVIMNLRMPRPTEKRKETCLVFFPGGLPTPAQPQPTGRDGAPPPVPHGFARVPGSATTGRRHPATATCPRCCWSVRHLMLLTIVFARLEVGAALPFFARACWC